MNPTILSRRRVRGSAPLDRIRYVWPPAFDPTVAPGVDAPVGSIAMCFDGLTAWWKVGSTATAWAEIAADALWGATIGGTTTALATAVDADGLACDTRGGWVLDFVGTIAGNTYQPGLRVNGAAAAGWYGENGITNGGVTDGQGVNLAAPQVTIDVGGRLHLHLESPLPESTVAIRCVHGWANVQLATGITISTRLGYILSTVGEITSVGVGRLVGLGQWAAGATYRVRRLRA